MINRKSCRSRKLTFFLISAPVLVSGFSPDVATGRCHTRLVSARRTRLQETVVMKASKKDKITKLFYQSGIVAHPYGNISESRENAFDRQTPGYGPKECTDPNTKPHLLSPSIENTRAVQSTIKERVSLKISTRMAVAFGLLLAMSSGFVNGVCLSGFWSHSHSTAAVTGTWTSSALALATGQRRQLNALMQYLLSYIGGSAIGGFLNPRPKPYEIDNPRGVAIGFGFISLALTSAGFIANGIRPGRQLFLCLCLIANGIQNSLTSSLTSNLCRTSHMSGMTSDIGTYVGQILRGNRENLLKLRVFSSLTIAFCIGAYVSNPVARLFDSRAMLLVASVHGTLAASLGYYSNK